MYTSFSSFSENLSNDLKKRLFDIFMNNDLIGVNITDANAKVLFLNDAHTRITGHAKELYRGKTMYELEKESVVSESATLNVIRTGKEITIRQTTSTGKTFEVRGIPVFDKSGKMEYIINLLTDVTEIVETKKKVMEMQEYTNILKQAISGDNFLVYQSNVMHRLVEQAKRVAHTDASVLIFGQFGVDKELIADLIHENSPRSTGNFIRVDCSSIPAKLMEGEFFGYEAGLVSGTGSKGKAGFLEASAGGTLYLEEIQELPYAMQNQLLRVLQTRRFRRIGGFKDISADFRLVCSVTGSLRDKISKREFSEDLYYRINVIEFNFPSLEERREDIPLLLSHYIKLYNTKYDTRKTFENDAFAYLCKYEYTGNVRELRNIIERIIIQTTSELVTLKDVLEAIGIHSDTALLTESAPLIDLQSDLSLKEIMEAQEKKLLEEYIKIYKNGSELAKKLKTDQSTISRKLNKYKIKY